MERKNMRRYRETTTHGAPRKLVLSKGNLVISQCRNVESGTQDSLFNRNNR